ncbi:unnamed protein product [Arabidopsis halleri]
MTCIDFLIAGCFDDSSVAGSHFHFFQQHMPLVYMQFCF